MNILISGASGFVGRALIKNLLLNGYNITALTRDLRRFDDFIDAKLNLIETDIENFEALKNNSQIKQLEKIDAIIHLAASLDYYGKSKKLFLANVKTTENLLNFAQEHNAKKFIFASSIEAVGPLKLTEIPAEENFPPAPVSTYGKSKLEAEKMIARRAKNIQIVTLRFGNIYGPGSEFLIAPFARMIKNQNNPLAKYLPAYCQIKLNPIYVNDAVGAIVNVLAGDKSGIYNIAGSETVTAGDLIQKIALQINVIFQIKQTKLSKTDALRLKFRTVRQKINRKADPLTYLLAGGTKRVHRVYSIQKAQTELNFNPKIHLEQGIKLTIEWLKQNNLI